MADGFYEFKVGKIECVAISDGSVEIDLDRMKGRFPGVDEKDLKKAIKDVGQDPDASPSHFNALLIRSGVELILVDAGSGPNGPAGTGKLIDNLASIGVVPANINHIVITHAHGDHVNGLLTKTGEFMFRNARYIISALDWNYWTNEERLK
ncbi:MAG: MBL fold metallo-hydrolase, partial [Chloroflexota bacterium]